jgi:hypothetical protein
VFFDRNAPVCEHPATTAIKLRRHSFNGVLCIWCLPPPDQNGEVKFSDARVKQEGSTVLIAPDINQDAELVAFHPRRRARVPASAVSTNIGKRTLVS